MPQDNTNTDANTDTVDNEYNRLIEIQTALKGLQTSERVFLLIKATCANVLAVTAGPPSPIAKELFDTLMYSLTHEVIKHGERVQLYREADILN